MYIYYKIYLQWIYRTFFFLSHVVSKAFASAPLWGSNMEINLQD